MRLRRFVLRWFIFLGILLVLFMVIAKLFENKLVYPGDPASVSWSESLDRSVRNVEFTSSEETKIHGWFLPCDGGTGAILVSHGNGGNLSHRDSLIHQLRNAFNRSVLIYDYPGYGKSEGKPSEAGCYSAGTAALEWLEQTEKIPPNRVILFGESLGGGVAVELAIRHESEALLLFSTFATLPKAAKSKFPFLPCEWLMSNRFESVSKLPKYRKPVFISHGDADEVIPFAHGQLLFDAANEPKRFLARSGASHNSPISAELLQEARQFLDVSITPAIP